MCVSGCDCFDCIHACAAQPSAALDRVGSAQQGAWSLGLQGRCVFMQGGEKDKEMTGRRLRGCWQDCVWHTEDKKVKRRGRTGGEVGMWSERGRERRSQGDQK